MVIFDFDDTIYNVSSWQGWGEYVRVMLTTILGSEEKAEKLLKTHNISYSTNGQQIATALVHEIGSAGEMIEYLNNNIYDFWVNEVVHLETKDFKKLAKKYSLYIVSNSPIGYLNYHLDKMGIDRSLFKGIYQNDFEREDQTKKVVYAKIIKAEGCEPSEAVMIGDSYANDIVPAIGLGIRGAWINTISDVRNIIKRLEEE